MTYLLDTNGISELRKIGDGKAAANVVAWVGRKRSASFFLSAITILELERGILGVQRHCAHLHNRDRRNEVDALIAATALIHGLTVVTRSVKEFERTGAIVVDPWLG